MVISVPLRSNVWSLCIPGKVLHDNFLNPQPNGAALRVPSITAAQL